MSTWKPNATVATVIEDNARYLLVEERDKTTGAIVFNQPAGHLEQGESLIEAAYRETLEETGWEIGITGIISVALYTSPANGITYHRTTFAGNPVRAVENAVLDPDIMAIHWLDYDEIRAQSAKMRSPLVLASIERQRSGTCFPLDVIANV